MGNANSNEVEQLKQLYSMNNFQLEALRKELIQQKQINMKQEESYKKIIDNLMQKQNGIKGRIPENEFDKVNDFLTTINRDIESQNSGVSNWKPGDSVQNKPNANVSRNANANVSRNANANVSRNANANVSRNDNDNVSRNANDSASNYRQHYEQISQSRDRSKKPDVNQTRNIPRRDYETTKKSDNEIDPYALYGLTKGAPFTLEQLKETYKKYALQTHPDVEGGSQRNFAIINNAYKFLVEELKKMENDKQYNQLKSESAGYLEAQEKSGLQSRELSGGNFNLNKFNNVFHENRIEDTSNEGYNSWLKENQYDTDDISRDSSITTGNFNSQFNSRVSAGRELQKYIIPQELNSHTSNVQELGVERVDNYSGESGKIRYTDLKEAHTTSRLVDPNTKYTQHKDVNSLKNTRSNMGDMPREQQEMLEQMDNNRTKNDAQREESQRRMDRMYAAHHDRMNNIFLGGR
jgi:hypothetical protein